MKSYESFDSWLNDQSKKNQAIIKVLRALIHKSAPNLEEQVKWGNGCFIGKNNGVIYLYADKEWVQYGFFNGVSLTDPKKKLEGKSKYIRHIKVSSPAAVDKAYFAKLLRQAVENEAASPNLPTKNQAIFEGLGKTALSAFAEAKITTLTKLAKYTEAEVLSLHGVGPRTLPLLRKALAAKGLLFKTPKPEKTSLKKLASGKQSVNQKVSKKKSVKKTLKKLQKKTTARK